MKKREVVQSILYYSELEEYMTIASEGHLAAKDRVSAEQSLKMAKDFHKSLLEAIDDSKDFGFKPELYNYNIKNTKSFQEWSKPQLMEDVVPSSDIFCAVDMKKLETVFEQSIELPLRKAMKVLIQKGWVTDYSSANYKDAEGQRFNMFVDRQNVAFIRFDGQKLNPEDKKYLMKGNHGHYMIYTPVWPEKPIALVEQELVQMAQNLPIPSYVKSAEIERE